MLEVFMTKITSRFFEVEVIITGTCDVEFLMLGKLGV